MGAAKVDGYFRLRSPLFADAPGFVFPGLWSGLRSGRRNLAWELGTGLTIGRPTQAHVLKHLCSAELTQGAVKGVFMVLVLD